MALRKLWSTKAAPNTLIRRWNHDSQAAAYRHVAELRRQWVAGELRQPTVTVWVDERDGHGWQLFERINFSEEG